VIGDSTVVHDRQLRQLIYAKFAEGERPASEEFAQLLGTPVQAVLDGFERLAAARALVLQPDGEILMAEPFSAVPTAFSVRSGNSRWWGNCIWDGLGIAAMLRLSAELETACHCCGLRLLIEIEDGARVVSGAGVAHFLVPAARWWDHVVFT